MLSSVLLQPRVVLVTGSGAIRSVGPGEMFLQRLVYVLRCIDGVPSSATFLVHVANA